MWEAGLSFRAVPARPPRDDVDALLRAQDWEKLSERLVRYAYVCINKFSWEDAREIAQEACLQAVDPDHEAWDTEKDPDVFHFLAHLVRGIVSNRRRVNMGRIAALAANPGKVAYLRPTLAPAPDEAAIERDYRRVAIRKLREKNAQARDERADRILELHSEGIDTAPEQARVLGCSVHEAEMAWQRVKRRLAEILEELDTEVESHG